MYIVIEKSHGGELYAYPESVAQFKRMEKEYRASMTKLPPQALETECALSDMPDNAYIAFKCVAPRKQAKKPKAKKKKKRAT